MHRFLIIQTAFTGDVVLATAMIEKLHDRFPEARIDFLLRKGNEGLLQNHPYINKLYIWDKKNNKNRNLFGLAMEVRKAKYTHVINAHRFAASGLITFLSGAQNRIGFDKNPFAFCYTTKATHTISLEAPRKPVHEIARNQLLIAALTDDMPAMPALYPSVEDYALVEKYKTTSDYICIAPSSVWFTKQFPIQKWIDLCDALPKTMSMYIIGAPSDLETAQAIIDQTKHPLIVNMCGKLSFLQSAALMEGAKMNYTNDSAPLHFASAMNAPVTAVFCSTKPAFGFGPLRENGHIVQTAELLPCRPCGLHGHKACPEGHFKCAYGISNEQLLWWTLNKI